MSTFFIFHGHLSRMIGIREQKPVALNKEMKKEPNLLSKDFNSDMKTRDYRTPSFESLQRLRSFRQSAFPQFHGGETSRIDEVQKQETASPNLHKPNVSYSSEPMSNNIKLNSEFSLPTATLPERRADDFGLEVYKRSDSVTTKGSSSTCFSQKKRPTSSQPTEVLIGDPAQPNAFGHKAQVVHSCVQTDAYAEEKKSVVSCEESNCDDYSELSFPEKDDMSTVASGHAFSQADHDHPAESKLESMHNIPSDNSVSSHSSSSYVRNSQEEKISHSPTCINSSHSSDSKSSSRTPTKKLSSSFIDKNGRLQWEDVNPSDRKMELSDNEGFSVPSHHKIFENKSTEEGHVKSNSHPYSPMTTNKNNLDKNDDSKFIFHSINDCVTNKDINCLVGRKNMDIRLDDDMKKSDKTEILPNAKHRQSTNNKAYEMPRFSSLDLSGMSFEVSFFIWFLEGFKIYTVIGSTFKNCLRSPRHPLDSSIIDIAQ